MHARARDYVGGARSEKAGPGPGRGPGRRRGESRGDGEEHNPRAPGLQLGGCWTRRALAIEGSGDKLHIRL